MEGVLTTLVTVVFIVLELASQGARPEELCGFRYMSTPFDKVRQVFYGDCNKNRSYICWNSVSREGKIEEGTHKQALRTCNVVGRNVLHKIANIFKRGYYWLKDSIFADRMFYVDRFISTVQYTDGRYESTKIPQGNLLKCGAYSRDVGLHFRTCTNHISSLCHFVNSTTTTKLSTVTTGFTRPISTVSTNVQSVEQSNDTLKTAATYSFDSTESVLKDFTMQLVTKSTSKENKAKTSKEDRDLGTKVGLAVGLSLTLICGIILSIYISRRYKCWNTTEKENNNTKAKHPSKQSTGRVVAHVNNSYEANEGIIVIKTTNQEVMKDESECQYKHPHYTDLDSEYAVAFKSNLGQNIEELSNLTETDYDVTGNFASGTSNTSDNIYNHFQSEQYDSSANVKRGDICNNEYGIIPSKESESVYDSTGQVNDSSRCDNIYNQLSLAISKDEQNYNDFTVNTSQIGQAKVTDQTYDKLK